MTCANCEDEHLKHAMLARWHCKCRCHWRTEIAPRKPIDGAGVAEMMAVRQ